MIYLAGVGTGIALGLVAGVVVSFLLQKANLGILSSSIDKISNAIVHPGSTDVVPDAHSVAELLLSDTMQDTERVPDWMEEEVP